MASWLVPHKTQADMTRNSPNWLALAFLMSSLLLTASLWWWNVAPQRQGGDETPAAPREVTPRGELDEDEQNTIRVFKSAKGAVVNVDTLLLQRDMNFNWYESQQGTGSGIVWDKRGHIVTNFHVIREAFLAMRRDPRVTIRVVLADGSAWNARLVGIAPDSDLAVLKIDAKPEVLKPIELIGSSKDLEVGMKVYAIGNPFGQSHSLTRGIISALDREILSVTDRPIRGVIQTDAALNPGNSGGPLLDRHGRLIGVNTAITSPSGGSVGIGYAVPVDTVNRVVPEMINSGREATPTLGILPVRERITRNLGIEKGVLIQSVKPNSAAAKARLRGIQTDPQTGDVILGDLILAVDGQEVRSVADLDRLIAKYRVGDKIRLSILREERLIEVEVELQGV